jgi:hypothetical protein
MTIQLILNTILILLLVLLLLVALIKNNIIILLITLIIFIIILPTIIINKFIINKRVVARKYLYKLSKYIYSTIHYDMNEVYEIYELNEMNRIFEIKNKIIDLHKTYYKYNSYSHVITNIEKELIIFKEKDLTNQMILNINNQKLLLSQNELYELIIMKKNGLKTDMFIYKSYLKDFFKSLNEINEIICYV